MSASLPLAPDRRRHVMYPSWAILLLAAMAAVLFVGSADARKRGFDARSPRAADGFAPLDRRAQAWIDRTLEGLSLEAKIGQLLMIQVRGQHHHPEDPDFRETLSHVRDLDVGGVIVSTSDVHGVPAVLDALDAVADLPLIVASDLERSLAFRIERGVVPAPRAMAIGATRSEDAARFLGELTAREGLALGIHWTFAPVVDVNNNPRNPVIHLRSFGEDPDLVSRLGVAFIEGARAGGMLTSAKHFPGHGDTVVDSHYGLPTVMADRDRLARVEWPPFRAAIDAGVDSVMVAHVSMPKLDPSGLPATLSPLLTDSLLRDEMGFEGLIITDAMDMEGVAGVWFGKAAEMAIRAGADIVLMPPDVRVARQSIVRAVREGRISVARIDESVRRVLEAKARLGLHRGSHRGRRAEHPVLCDVARPLDIARAEEIAADAITLVRNGGVRNGGVRNEGGVLPLAAEADLDILHLVVRGALRRPATGAEVRRALADRNIAAETWVLGREIAPSTAEAVLARAREVSHVVASVYARVPGSPDRPSLRPSVAALVDDLAAGDAPLILVSYLNPYLLTEHPNVPVYLNTFGRAETNERAAVAALFGEQAIRGRLPVSLPGIAAAGEGIDVSRRPMALEGSGDKAETPNSFPVLPGLDELLEGFVDAGAFPGATLAVGHQGRLVHLDAYGRQTFESDAPPMAVDTIFDLASLTKVIATTAMAMMLVDEGRLDLDTPVDAYLPGFVGEGKATVTVRHLLTHSSGVDWWAPLFEEMRGAEAYRRHIEAMPLAYETGTQTKYSDLGLILLGAILERVSGQSLDAFVASRLFRPLGMVDTGYLPSDALHKRIAPTEMDAAWRDRLLHGEVHDENAHALGGVAPHAGLFGTAGDLARFAQMMLMRGVYDHRRLVSRATIDRFTTRAGIVDGSTRALGWDTKSAEGSSAGTHFGPRSFGHTGFTGTSIWIDPDRQLFVVLLTNRVNPSRENNAIRRVRPAVHDAVVRALESGSSKPSPPPRTDASLVRVGLERLDSQAASTLAGKRLGLVVHSASRTDDNRHAIDVVRDHGLEVVRLFSPEHGLRGQAAAGEAVDDGRDPESGLPIVSLYGAARQPTPEDLEGLDALVFDLQGAGVRFYTYVSTLMLCLEAAAEANIDFVVLDRPNPLGGEQVAGPVRAGSDVVPKSFVSMAPGPLVHGLTLGEMARFVNRGLPRPARLVVVPMSGWRRSMTWADTGRRWWPPSPNLRSPDAALAYPGVALLEATNVSEGRGTNAPFLYLGAPWIAEGSTLAPRAGFRFEPTRFVPTASPAAPHPKFQDETVHGWRVEVDDPDRASPYLMGVSVLAELSNQPGFRWRREGEALTWLLGTSVLVDSIRSSETVDAIIEQDQAGIDHWRAARASVLIYD